MSQTQRSQGEHPDSGHGSTGPEAAAHGPVPEEALSPPEAPEAGGSGPVAGQDAAEAGSTAEAEGTGVDGAASGDAGPDTADGAGADSAGPVGTEHADDGAVSASAGPGGAGPDSASGSAEEVARPPSSASSDEAATPAEAGPDGSSGAGAEDAGGSHDAAAAAADARSASTGDGVQEPDGAASGSAGPDGSGGAGPDSPGGPAEEVARPPSSASSDEAATPTEPGPDDYGIMPAPDRGAHMISWIQHGGGKLPPSIAPAMPPVAASQPSDDPDPAPQEDPAPREGGFESSITPTVVAHHPERVWSEPGHDAGETVLGEARWPALRAEGDRDGAGPSADSAGSAAPAAPAGAAPAGAGQSGATPSPGQPDAEQPETGSPARAAASPSTANWATAPAWPITAGHSGADDADSTAEDGHAEEAAAASGRAAGDQGGAAGDAGPATDTAGTAKTTGGAKTAPRRRRLLPLGAAAGIAILLAWGGLAWWTTQHIASGTTVSGVDLSGLSPEQASTRLGEQIGAQLAQPVTLTVGQGSSELVPSESGVSLDTEATMDEVAGFTLNPLTIAQRLGGAQSDAVLRVDSETLTGALEDRIDSMANGAVSATVSLEGTEVTTTPAQDGVGLDVKASVAQLSQGWPLGQQSIALAEGVAVPAITDQEAKDFVDSTLSPMLSADMAITAVGTQVESKATTPTVTLTPEQTASMTSISTDGGRLTATIDTTMLHDNIVGTMGDVEKPAIDASWTIDGTQAGAAGDKPQYVAPAEGMGIDMDSLTQSLTTTAAQGTDPASRTVALPLTVLKPEDTTPEADWGVKEVVGEYSTRYNAEDLPRTQNLRRGAELINGSVVKPGEVFSLEEALGEVDYEHGFADAGVISNGEHIDSLGGGLSQVATTVFNAGFEAGMDDTEHHPHQYYFDRYPAGREATLWTGKLDVKFTNSTTHGVLVQAWLDGEEIHVRLWSTKYYDVTITESERYNFRPVVTERKSGPQCQPYTGGNPGFDITITRKRSHNGQAVPDDVLTTAYYPDNNIVCG
ncbi:VanW family protein [Actinomyces bowdenii]|uniref:VanW family protein n=1 Tax=Actinomyces bowdenii TaxID=131109 RepID=UPI00214CB773|nr:VanW family protein [Actinomyces bowdenii]MCR2052907.1 VanW family protein [Actinomyces bowdenii]